MMSEQQETQPVSFINSLTTQLQILEYQIRMQMDECEENQRVCAKEIEKPIEDRLGKGEFLSQRVSKMLLAERHLEDLKYQHDVLYQLGEVYKEEQKRNQPKKLKARVR